MCEHTNRPSGLTITFTSPCQFARAALSAFKAARSRGTFLIPFSWPCIAFAMSIFSGRVKHSIASWRAFITSRESEGIRSHVRSRERPSVVFVLSSMPANLSIRITGGGIGRRNTNRTETAPLWSWLSGSTHGFHFRKLARNCEAIRRQKCYNSDEG